MEELLHNVCLLLSSSTREIVKAALGFVKVLLFVMDPKTLASHVSVIVCRSRPRTLTRAQAWGCYLCVPDPCMLNTHCYPPCQMDGIGNLKDDMKRHFRTKLKNIFTKLTRKFG